MTPSNPDNNKPFIYRFLDSLGVAHLVVPMEHTHDITEITNLSDYIPVGIAGGDPGYEAVLQIFSKGAVIGSSPTGFGFQVTGSGGGTFEITTQTLANLQRASSAPDSTPTANSNNLVTSGGVKAALDAKRQIRQDDSETSDHAIVSATASEGDVYIMLSVREGDDIKSVHITPDNMENLIRALLTPDSTPTANSNNLVTSGGVASALASKANTNHTHSYNENGLYVHLYTKNAGDNPLVAVANTIFNNNGNPYLLHIAVKNNTGNSLAINDMIIGNGTYVIPSETNNSIPDGYIGIIDLYRFTGDSNYYATVSTLFPISA